MLNQNNLNFVTDNIQVSVHNFLVDTFDNIKGYDTHQHSSYELHFIKKGHGTVTYDGKVHDIGPGDLYLLAPNTPHSQTVDTASMYEYALRFDIKNLHDYNTNNSIANEAIEIIDLLSKTTNKIYHNQHLIEACFEKSYNNYYQEYPGYYLIIKQCIMEIIINTARLSIIDQNSYTHYSLPKNNIELKQLETIISFIKDNLEGQISNQLLAEHIHISKRQLHRLVKKHTNQSPHQLIVSIRISTVKQLLSQKIYTLKTISQLTGFSSEFHLSSSFKKHEGLTPREYKRKSIDEFIPLDTE